MKNTYACSIYLRGSEPFNQGNPVSSVKYSKNKEFKVVLVKSPHVHKKSKERFVFAMPSKAIFVSKKIFNNKIDLLFFIETFLKCFSQKACVSYFFKVHVQRTRHLSV